MLNLIKCEDINTKCLSNIFITNTKEDAIRFIGNNEDKYLKEKKEKIYFQEFGILQSLKGNYMLIGGRPGSGKTILLSHMAKKIAQQDDDVLYLSLDMKKEDIEKRYLSDISNISYGKILNNKLSVDETMALNNAKNNTKWLSKIHIIYNQNMDILDVIYNIIYYKKKYNIKAVCIDFLQAIKLSNGETPKCESEYSKISEFIIDILKKYDIAGFINVQANRIVNNRTKKIPCLNDLKYNNTIINNALYIITTYKDDICNIKADKQNKLDVMVIKNRLNNWLGKLTFETFWDTKE